MKDVVSVVIPVYKSVESLKKLTEQFSALHDGDFAVELIFVNDSPFHAPTREALHEVNHSYDFVRVITLRKNRGQHIATLIGLHAASGDFVVTMDDDLQHPVEEVPNLYKAIVNDPDTEAIFAVPRYADKKHSLWRNFGSYVINKTDHIFLKKPQGLRKSPFRILRGDLAKAVVGAYSFSPVVSSLVVATTDNIRNIEVSHKEREYGVSSYTIGKLITLTLNNILMFSSLPLKLMGYIGFSGFVFSVLFIATILIRKFFGGIDFPGYTSTVVLISFFGGLNLLGVGLIGEYLIRIIKEQNKPRLDDLIK